MFKHHRDRLIASAEAFSWPSVISLLSGSEGYNILYKAIINHLDTNPPEKPLKACPLFMLNHPRLMNIDPHSSI